MIKTVYRSKFTDLENIFGYYLCSQLLCLNCFKLELTFDLSTDLILDIIPKKKNNSILLKQINNTINYNSNKDEVSNINININNNNNNNDINNTNSDNIYICNNINLNINNNVI